MSTINKQVIEVALMARKAAATGTQGDTYVSFVDDGSFNEKRIAYVVLHNHWYYSAGWTVFDPISLVATISDSVLDIFEVGLAASTTPPAAPDAQATESSEASNSSNVSAIAP